MNAAATAPFEGVYLRTYLRPFARWLEDAKVTELLVNRPGEVWVESIGRPDMQRFEAPEVTDVLIERLAAQVARASHQGINRASPLLAATLPDGERIQVIGPPVTRNHWAMAIRRYVAIDAAIDDYLPAPGRTSDPIQPAVDPVTDPAGFLRSSVLARKTILISGGTSSGKTTFLNALLKIAPAQDRIITVEDTAEVSISQPNTLGLVAVKGELGEARVGVEDLLDACLRLRPDRIIVGEVRGPEAATFLRAVNTGHPGSITTVHANSPEGALEQLALMVLQSGMALSRDDTRAYCRSVIDIIVQLARVGGVRQIVDIVPLKA